MINTLRTVSGFGIALLLILACLLFAPIAKSAPLEAGGSADALADPVRIVEKADLIRFPAEGFQVDISVTTISADGPAEAGIHEYRVLSQGIENSIVQTMAPASERGQIMLMKGSDLWVFMPEVSQAIRLPLSQRLTGQVANGDLARANFRGDYDATLLRTESIDGQTYQVLELTASNRRVTYHRALYWVEQGSNRPYQAEFYTLSGRLLKTARYENYQSLGGAIRPTRMTLKDALKENEYSVMEYRDMVLRELPDKMFTKNYLKKLR